MGRGRPGAALRASTLLTPVGANDEVGQAYLERETITELGYDLPPSDRFLISGLHTPLAKFTREMQACCLPSLTP
jgi:hypothetical protein